MKKAFLALAVLCAVGMMAGCDKQKEECTLNNYLKTEVMTRNDDTFLDECKLYFTEAEKDSTYFTYDNQLFFQFSSVNIKNYRKI